MRQEVEKAKNKKIHHRKGEFRMVGSTEDDLAWEVKKLWEGLAKMKDELKNTQRKTRKPTTGKKSTSDEGCYGCGKKGYFVRNCLKCKDSVQGHESQQLD